MKVVLIYNQLRRDCWVDLKCENCGNEETRKSAYDDRNYWDNVIPNVKCGKCNKSTKELGLIPEVIQTKYEDFEVV